jgi:hypothetical protein
MKHEISFKQSKPKQYQYNNNSDIYSFGVLFWIIMTGKPSQDNNIKDLFKPPIKPDHYELLRQICCNQDPTKRPTAARALRYLCKGRLKDTTCMVNVGMFVTSPNSYVHNILSNAICRNVSQIEIVSTTNTESGDVQMQGIKMTCTLEDNRDMEFYMMMACSIDNYQENSDILQLPGGVFSIKNLYIRPSHDGPKQKPVLEIDSYTKITLLDYVEPKSTPRKREYPERIPPNILYGDDVDDQHEQTVCEEKVNNKRKIDDVINEVCEKTKKCLKRIQNNKDQAFIIEICADAIKDISNDIYGFGLIQSSNPSKKRKLYNKSKE